MVGLRPSERLRLLRQVQQQRAAERAAREEALGLGPKPEIPEGPSAEAAQRLERLLVAGKQDEAVDWLSDNRGTITDEDAEFFGLNQVLETYDAQSEDKPSFWDRAAGTVLGPIAKPLELLARPGQAALEAVQQGIISDLPGTGPIKALGHLAGTDWEDYARRDREGGGSWGDVGLALRGKERFDPVNGGKTRNLTLGAVLDRTDPGGSGVAGRARGLAYNAFQFGGEAAIDPINLVGGPGAGAAKAGQKAAAKVLAKEIAEEGLESVATRISPRLLREIGEDASEDAIYEAIRKTGVRGLSGGGAGTRLAPVYREKIIEEIAGNATATTRSGRRVAAGRGQRIPHFGYAGRPGIQRITDGAEAAGAKQLDRALRYDRGGLRVGGRSVIGRTGFRRVGELPIPLTGRNILMDTTRRVPQAELDARLLGEAATEADAAGRLADRLTGRATKRAAKAEKAQNVPAVIARGWDRLEDDLFTFAQARRDQAARLADEGAEGADEAAEEAETLIRLLSEGDTDSAARLLKDTKARRVPGEGRVLKDYDALAKATRQRFEKAARIRAEADELRAQASAPAATADEIRRAIDSGDTDAVVQAAPGAGKATQEVVETVRPGLLSSTRRRTSGVAEAFSPRARMRRSASLREGTDEGFYRIQGETAGTVGIETERRTRTFRDAFKTVDPGERAIIRGALDTGEELDEAAIAGLSEAGQNAYRVASEEREKLFTTLTDEIGIPTAKLREANDYLPRVFTKKGEKRILDAIRKGKGQNIRGAPTASSGATAQDGALKLRTLYPDLSLDAFERQLRQDYKIPEKVELLEKDPAKLLALRGQQVDAALNTTRFLDEAAGKLRAPDGGSLVVRIKPNEVGSKAGVAAEEAAKKRGLVGIDLGDGGRAFAHPDIAPDISKVVAIIENDESLRAVTQMIDSWNGLWKGWATVPLISGPGFFARNATGNVFANYIAGIRSPLAYARSADIQRKIWKAKLANPELSVPDALDALGDSTLAAKVELAMEQGAIGEGFFRTDDLAPDAARQLTYGNGWRDLGSKEGRRRIGRANWENANPLSRNNAIIRSGAAFNRVIEDNARLTHFLEKLDETGDAVAAGASTKRYLFDYGDLTDFERRIAKRGIAFWTYMRKNTPLILRETIENPARVLRAQGAAEVPFRNEQVGDDTWDGRATNKVNGTVVPEWAQERGNILPTGMFGATNPTFGQMDTPLVSAGETLDPALKLLNVVVGDGTGEELAQSIANLPSGGPQEAARIIVEEATGKSMFTGGNIRDPETEERKKDIWLRFSQAVVPAADKAVGTYNVDDRATEEWQTRVWEALTGVNVRTISEEDSEKGQGYAAGQLTDLLEEAEEQGIDVPSIKDLKLIGLVPDRVAEWRAQGETAGTPRRRRRRRA